MAPKQFDNKLRKVELKGKAFFKVFRDESHPFIVISGNIEIQVLGTSFEVESDTIENTVTVSVFEGKVLVNHKKTNYSKIILTNNQIKISQQGKLIEKTVLRNENNLAWKSGILTFDNSPMKLVVKDLSQLYNKVFIFRDKEIEDYILTTKINNQSLNEVKIILEKALDIGLKVKNDTIILFKNQ